MRKGANWIQCMTPPNKSLFFKQYLFLTDTLATLSTCPMCGQLFRTLAEMKQHLELLHKKYQCDICNKLMSHKRNVDRHRKSVHENQRGYGCPMCDYRSAHKQVCSLVLIFKKSLLFITNNSQFYGASQFETLNLCWLFYDFKIFWKLFCVCLQSIKSNFKVFLSFSSPFGWNYFFEMTNPALKIFYQEFNIQPNEVSYKFQCNLFWYYVC